MSEFRGFKFVATLVLEFKKIQSNDQTKYGTFYLNPRAETIINESDINDVLESVYIKIISNLKKYIWKGLSWIINSVIDSTTNISK